MEEFFPLITVRRKSTDSPWVNNKIRKLIKRRRKVYRKEGRSAKWKRLKRLSDDLIDARRSRYLESQKQGLLVEDAARNFFRNVKAFQAKERPQQFDVRSLYPGLADQDVADELSRYFNRISSEFSPIESCQIPRTHDRALPRLEPYQVAGRIKAFKKPKSMVQGDIFPALMDKFGILLALPLTDIFNEISSTFVWPRCWKKEYVTVIPKCRAPVSVGDLRNISCTMLPSKIFESYVLNWLSTEVTCKTNQYGGIKGSSVSHLLVDLWDEIAWNLEDGRAATMITAIDYAKAFNRLSFQHCLEAFARKGASSQTISLLATFLSNRTMSVRVSNTWSSPLPVYGGVPQGSILGVLLFNIATDDLEDGQEDNRTLRYSHDEICSSLGSVGEPPREEEPPAVVPLARHGHDGFRLAGRTDSDPDCLDMDVNDTEDDLEGEEIDYMGDSDTERAFGPVPENQRMGWGGSPSMDNSNGPLNPGAAPFSPGVPWSGVSASWDSWSDGSASPGWSSSPVGGDPPSPDSSTVVSPWNLLLGPGPEETDGSGYAPSAPVITPEEEMFGPRLVWEAWTGFPRCTSKDEETGTTC